jgi:hypothetical protein
VRPIPLFVLAVIAAIVIAKAFLSLVLPAKLLLLQPPFFMIWYLGRGIAAVRLNISRVRTELVMLPTFEALVTSVPVGGIPILAWSPDAEASHGNLRVIVACLAGSALPWCWTIICCIISITCLDGSIVVVGSGSTVPRASPGRNIVWISRLTRSAGLLRCPASNVWPSW